MPEELVIECKTWDDFIREVRHSRVAGSYSIFRGHADSTWRLESQFHRWMRAGRSTFGDQADRVRHGHAYPFLYAFKKYAIGLTGPTFDFDDDDWRELGRHHGLTTDVLDWTESPYVAAFFAATQCIEMSNPGFLSGMPFLELKAPSNLRYSVIELNTTQVLRDRGLVLMADRSISAYRQKAQRGLFTRLGDEKYLTVEDFLLENSLSHHMVRYVLPSWTAVRAVLDLELMNIHFSTLFPDLDGAARQANLWMSRSLMLRERQSMRDAESS